MGKRSKIKQLNNGKSKLRKKENGIEILEGGAPPTKMFKEERTGNSRHISNDIDKISQFCLQQSNIPSVVMTDILSKIEKNNIVSNKISQLEKELEDITANVVVKENKEDLEEIIKKNNNIIDENFKVELVDYIDDFIDKILVD